MNDARRGRSHDTMIILESVSDSTELDFPQFVFEVTPTLLKSASDLQRVHCEWKRDEKSDAIFGKVLRLLREVFWRYHDSLTVIPKQKFKLTPFEQSWQMGYIVP